MVVVPGYGMNSYIFDFHPSGPSMVETWASLGFEVWTVDPRGHGASRRLPPARRSFGLADLALNDLAVALDFVAANTLTERERVFGVGCSLGGTLLFAHTACRRGHRVAGLVAMGSPLRWEAILPIFEPFRRVPGFAATLAVPGSRFFAGLLLPRLARAAPSFLHPYMHLERIDPSATDRMVLTVERLYPRLNREIARWMASKDLVLGGCDVTRGFYATTMPLLCVVADSDGIVPEATALSACHRSPGPPGEVLRVGTADRPYAHADLFISEGCHEDVFLPVAAWLSRISSRVA